MGKLDKTICYLVGPIDYASDQGVGWRQEFISKCRSTPLRIMFLDPTDKLTGLQEEIGKEHEHIVTLKENEEWDQLRLRMKRIVREDHQCVDKCDFIVFYLEPDVHTCGSYFELQSALTQKKPYFIIVKGGKKKTPAWLFGICDHNYFFNSIDEVVERLNQLNRGDESMSDRWVLFRKQLEEQYKQMYGE